MLHNALGPVWHAKHTAPGIIPDGRRGVDQEATWSKRPRDGWVYGPGSCCVVSHAPWMLGAFTDRRHSGHEATRLWWETGPLRGVVETVMLEGKADAPAVLAEFQRQRGMTLRTTPRQHSDQTAARPQMINVLNRPQNRRLRQPRGQTVEPMPGVVKDLFALERWWMRGHRHNRWLFAAMGVTVQMHQARALKRQRAVWKIKPEVLGW
jgi:hypothetical protein